MLNFRAFPSKGQIIVFDYADQVVGYAIITWVWTNEFGADVLWLDEIAVHKNYRGFGIGKRFFSWLKESYSQAPAYSLLVSEHNQKAKKLYQEIGFKPVQQQMLKVNDQAAMTEESIKLFAKAI